MAREVSPVESIKSGTPNEKRFYLRRALWSDKGLSEARKEVREDDLIFWLGGDMPHVRRVECNSRGEAENVVERFRDGLLPEGGWDIYGFALEGMTLRVTDKDLNILADITIGEDEIAQGRTRDGIRLVCGGSLFESTVLSEDQAEVMLEGFGENAAQAYTMHTSGAFDLSVLELCYKTYQDLSGRRYSMVVSLDYGKCDGDAELHQWRQIHLSRYGVKPMPFPCSSDIDVRITLDEDGSSILVRAWSGAEAFPLDEIVKNPKKYACQYEKLSKTIAAWDLRGDVEVEDIVDRREINLGLSDGGLWMREFLEALKPYEAHDYRPEETLNREAEYQKIRSCRNCHEDVIWGAGWKPSDGEPAAVKIIAQYCGVSEAIVKRALDEGVWEPPVMFG